MNKTQIEWAKNPDGSQGYTWNPITGCLNHINGICKGGNFPCYAYRLSNTRLREKYLSGSSQIFIDGLKSKPVEEAMSDPFYPRFWEERLGNFGKPDSYGYQVIRHPKGIFVCDMGELFGDWIPSDWQKVIFNYIKDYPEHRFYLLTKQPQNLIKFSPFPNNCWVGITVTNEGIAYPDMMEEACRSLAEIKATVKYISFEPLLSSIYKLDLLEIWGINWLIIGAQTKPYKPPKIEWVREIVEAADKAGIPVFLKNNLMPIMGGYPIPKENMWAYKFKNGEFLLRQELP